MSGEITINDYDRNLEIGLNTNAFLEVDIEGRTYFVKQDDYFGGSMTEKHILMPKKAYERVSFDEDTGTAKAREITDRSLVQRIAVELHFQGLKASGDISDEQ